MLPVYMWWRGVWSINNNINNCNESKFPCKQITKLWQQLERSTGLTEFFIQPTV